MESTTVLELTLESLACGGNWRAVQAVKAAQAPEGPHRAVAAPWRPECTPPVGKGSVRGMQFEYLEPRTMKILERKFSDKSETNKAKAIIC